MELKWLPTSVSCLRFDGRGVWLVVNSEQDVWWHWRRRRRRSVKHETEWYDARSPRNQDFQQKGSEGGQIGGWWFKTRGSLTSDLSSSGANLLAEELNCAVFRDIFISCWATWKLLGHFSWKIDLLGATGLYNVSLLIVGLEPPTIGIVSQHSDTLSYPLTFEAHPPARSSFIFGPFNFKNDLFPSWDMSNQPQDSESVILPTEEKQHTVLLHCSVGA